MKWQRTGSTLIRVYFLCAAAAVVIVGNSAVCAAEVTLPKIRFSSAGDKFDGTEQLAAVFEIPSWRVLRASHFEVGVGSVFSRSGNEAFVSIGPVWRFPIARSRYFMDIGVSPTLLSGSLINGRNLGGRFHFTSSISLGARLGRGSTLALRAQHTSNGGLSDTNPGMDMIGIEFSFQLPN